VGIHPYELSYYNELIGGPRGAWARGFELSYWYDAFNPPVIRELNARLPHGAQVDFLNQKTNVVTFQELQCLGALRPDVRLIARQTDRFPYVWLLTQDSKATAFTRLLFAMRPWYASEPRQLRGARVASVIDPIAVSRAWALQTLLDGSSEEDSGPSAPEWVREHVPWLARLWGDGLTRVRPLALRHDLLEWSRSDPEGLLAAGRHIAAKQPVKEHREAERLMRLITDEPNPSGQRHYYVKELIHARPEALVEAIQMLAAHPDEIERAQQSRTTPHDRQRDQVDSERPPVRCSGRDSAQQEICCRVTDQPRERLGRSERTEDSPLFVHRRDSREKPRNAWGKDPLSQPQECECPDQSGDGR
jgi:hypothetical protein